MYKVDTYIYITKAVATKIKVVRLPPPQANLTANPTEWSG